jgi:hypothetical protein
MEIEETEIFIISIVGTRDNTNAKILLLGKKRLFLYPEMSPNKYNGLIHANIK